MKKTEIEQLKKKYKNQWLLVKVLEEDELNRPIEGILLSNSKNREDVYNALLKVKPKEHVATFYTGKISKKGYAVAF
ncbi:hypothetical protein HY750_03495 [Candidatus Kuenenbacteria bacterium]|nr:hypothetical protein [Candidatus Kuenenbacteria bacterium]